MRAVTTLLLLLMLPGLLLPAGAALRVCLCPAPTAAQPGCCAAHEASEPPSCCGGGPSTAGERDGERTCARPECHCVWLQVPDDAQPPAPLPAVEVAVPAPPPAVAAVVLPPIASPPVLRRWPAPDNRPPPPFRQRNLPLRL